MRSNAEKEKKGGGLEVSRGVLVDLLDAAGCVDGVGRLLVGDGLADGLHGRVPLLLRECWSSFHADDVRRGRSLADWLGGSGKGVDGLDVLIVGRSM